MPLVIALFMAVATAIVVVWSWLGVAIPMPSSPLAPGEKLYCISYAPFRGQQNPLDAGTRIDAHQIEEDLAQLSRITNCVRTYSIEHGLDQIAGIAARQGLKVMQGIWLSSHPEKNRTQIETGMALARRYPDTIQALVVGNEVLLRGEMAATDLAATIRWVKGQVAVPVTYADVWEFWLRHREVYDSVDFLTIHILPYWEDFPIAATEAARHVDSIRNRVVAAFPGKEILIGESGWPSFGRMRESALPSSANQGLVLHDVLAAAKRGGYQVNLIEAFDQPWKRWLEGTVGGHWGLFDDVTRVRKFAWGEPISNHPQWVFQATAGVTLSAAIFAAVWFGRRGPREASSPRAWLGIAAIALVSGSLIGWAIEKALLESLGLGGWLRSFVLLALAAAAPIIAAVALIRDTPLPSLAQVLGGTDDRPADMLAVALGLVFVLLCATSVQIALGLVFDPRYKDFPFAALSAAALPYLPFALARPRIDENRTAEIVLAAVLGLSASYVVLNESFANWQAVWFTAVLAALVLILLRAGAAPGLRSAKPPP